MSKPIVVHINDVMQYKACRRKWDWASRSRGNLAPKMHISPLFIGTAVHAAIEAHTSDGVPMVRALAQHLRSELKGKNKQPYWTIERPRIREDVRMMRGILEQYQTWARHHTGPFADRHLDQLAHELRFDLGSDSDYPAVPLMVDGEVLQPVVYLAGRLDGMVRRRVDDSVWVSEYKTCRGIEERAKLLQHDEQATAYVYAAQVLQGEPVAGIIYTLMRKKIAARPEPLKRGGGLSKNKMIDTSVETYRDAIRTYHGPVDERWIQDNYGEILAYIADFKEPFVARVAIQRTQEQLNRFVRELHAVALEMNDPNTVLYANRTYSCPGCQFRQMCLATDRGELARVELLRTTEFAPREEV